MARWKAFGAGVWFEVAAFGCHPFAKGGREGGVPNGRCSREGEGISKSCGYRGPSTRRRNIGVGALRMTRTRSALRWPRTANRSSVGYVRDDSIKRGQLSQLGIAILRAVTGFSAVAIRHPYCLDTLPVRKSEEIADCAVGGDKLFLQAR